MLRYTSPENGLDPMCSPCTAKIRTRKVPSILRVALVTPLVPTSVPCMAAVFQVYLSKHCSDALATANMR
jgi:hypothetical protein